MRDIWKASAGTISSLCRYIDVSTYRVWINKICRRLIRFIGKVCLAPKRRFKVYDAPVARNANDMAVRKARKEDLKKTNSAFGQALPIGIAVGLLGIVGTFLYLNSTL